MNDILNKLKLGKHYRMERFSMLFCVLLAGLMIVSGVCLTRHFSQQDTTLLTKAVYSKKFTLSRTNTTGVVEGVYTSNDKTKTLLVLKFDDPQKISTNAKNYQMFLTGASVERNKQTLEGHPSGSIYMFGNSGYMGVYLVNKNGFGPQILDLTIRANMELSAIENSSNVNAEVEDASFVKHDQLRVYFNPGGSEARSLACLNKEAAPSATDFYNEAIVQKEEAALHERYAKEINQMRVDLQNIEEMTDRADSGGLKVPPMPDVIAGDEVVTKTEDDHEVMMYKPKTILPGGFNLDWQNKSVTDGGFLKDLIKSTDTPNMSIDQFFAKMGKEKNADATRNQFDANYKWETKQNTLVEDLNGTNATRYAELTKLGQNVQSAYRTYYNHKKAYQQDSLNELLVLEMRANAVQSIATVNTEENVLQCY